MAPRETPKATPKVEQRTVTKTKSLKAKPSPVSSKNTMSAKRLVPKTPLKGNNKVIPERKRTFTVPNVATPKPKENKSAPVPDSITKSARKPGWKTRPKPAHSGVPLSSKMQKVFEKQLLEDALSL